MKHLRLLVAACLIAVPALARPPHGNVAVPGPPGLALLAVEDGTQGQTYTLGGDGTFTGSAPGSMTATISGCGGGSLTTSALVAPSYGTGTYQVQFSMPTAIGTGCIITVTDNLSRVAISQPIKVISATPGSTVTANIHNAPGWQASHSYTSGSPNTDVNNGAGWTPGSPGHYIPGSALNAYRLTSGSCTSASSGGPSGTGGSISDGTCTWKYLSGVDYITMTGWQIDAPLWVSGRTYTYFQVMTLNDGGTLRSYELDGANENAFCTSTVPPTGTGAAGGLWSMGQQTTSDSCVWDYLGDVTYSSQVASIPTLTYVNNAAAVLSPTPSPPFATMHMDRPYTATAWNDVEYVAGSGGERNPLAIFNHVSNTIGLEDPSQGQNFAIFIGPASGEGFASSLTASTPLAGYDATKGVAIRNPNATGGFPAAASTNAGPAGFLMWDAGSTINGFQIKSTSGPGVLALDGPTITNNIIDGGWNNILSNNAWCMGVFVDNIAIVYNNLILSHGCAGVAAKYGNSFFLWNTIVNVGGVSNTTGVLYGWTWVFQDVAIADNAISGYTHVVAEDSAVGPSPINSASVGNVTDVASPDNTGTSWWIDQNATRSNVKAAPGTTFGVSAASMFIAPGTDYRPNTGLSAAGAAFGAFYVNCWSTNTPPCVPAMQTHDTPDILGNARPNGSSQYSTGAEQHP